MLVLVAAAEQKVLRRMQNGHASDDAHDPVEVMGDVLFEKVERARQGLQHRRGEVFKSFVGILGVAEKPAAERRAAWEKSEAARPAAERREARDGQPLRVTVPPATASAAPERDSGLLAAEREIDAGAGVVGGHAQLVALGQRPVVPEERGGVRQPQPPLAGKTLSARHEGERRGVPACAFLVAPPRHAVEVAQLR